MFISKSDKVPSIVTVGARETIVVQINKSDLANGMSGKVTFYRYSMADERPNTKGWRTADGFVAYTDAITISVGSNVGSSKLMGNYIFGTVAEYSGFIPNIADFKVIPGNDRGIVLLRQRPTATEYCAHVPNTGALKLIPSMDHDIKNANMRDTASKVFGMLIYQELYDPSSSDHFTSYDNAVERWESRGGLTNAKTIDTTMLYQTSGVGTQLDCREDYIRVKIFGYLYLDTPGTWEIWDYRDNASACDFGGSIGYINSATTSWTQRASYTATKADWVPFTWYFVEGSGGEYFSIHIKGPNDSSHRAIKASEMMYTADQIAGCSNVPAMPTLVFHMPLKDSLTDAATGQTMSSVGSPIIKTVDGRTGMYCDGSSYLYTTNTAGIPTGTNGRILCAWVYPTGECEGDYVMSIGSNSTNTRYGFGVSDDSTHFGVWGYSNTILFDKQPIKNKWQHVMVLYQGRHTKLFIDGVLIDTKEHDNLNTGSTHICIGAGAGDFAHVFQGYVSDVRIYSGICCYNELRKIIRDCLRSSR